MVLALIYVGCSITILALLSVVYAVEDTKGKRVFLVSMREGFDALLFKALKGLSRLVAFFTHGFMRVMLHYGAHSVLKRVLAALRRMEKKVEDLVRQNKKIAKDIHMAKTRNHLDEIADHKEEVALSEKEKEELLSR